MGALLARPLLSATEVTPIETHAASRGMEKVGVARQVALGAPTVHEIGRVGAFKAIDALSVPFWWRVGAFMERRPGKGTGNGGSGVVGAGTRATLGIVRGGTVSGANGGVERSETVPTPSCTAPARGHRSREGAPLPRGGAAPGKGTGGVWGLPFIPYI